MADTDQRDGVSALAGDTGWNHRAAARNDYFDKGVVRVHLVWQGDDAISGGTLYHDDLLQSFTRQLSTVQGWLRR